MDNKVNAPKKHAPGTSEQQEEATQPKSTVASEGAEAMGETTEMTTLLEEANDKYIRLVAEFDNFRKRSVKEKITMVALAAENVISKLLPILDDFERGLLVFKAQEDTKQSHQEGMKIIYDKLLRLLKQEEVAAMEVKKGDIFDTEKHEAISKTAVKDEALKGKVVEVVTKGYLLKDKVIRFAKVIIGV